MITPYSVASRFALFAFVLITILASYTPVLARPEIYLRPAAQYTWLSGASKKADIYYYEPSGNGTGLIPANLPVLVVDNYTASSGAAGGGLAIGGSFGKRTPSEIGIEVSQTQFSGSCTITPFHLAPTNVTNLYIYRTLTATNRATDRSVTKTSCTFKVRSIYFTYRQFFGPQTNFLRPYVGFLAGNSQIEISSASRETAAYYIDSKPLAEDRTTLGLVTGLSFRLGSKTNIEVGYRMLFSGQIRLWGSDKSGNFYKRAHAINLNLSQRF